MRSLLLLLLAVILLVASPTVYAEQDASHGFAGDRLAWAQGGFSGARRLAIDSNKPLMVLVHKTWCGACKSLKRDFDSNTQAVEELARVAQNYVIVNLEDDESETAEAKPVLSPNNAGYIPRAVFFNSKGEVMPQVQAKDGNKQYPYFYHNVQTLAKTMEAALPELQGDAIVAKEL